MEAIMDTESYHRRAFVEAVTARLTELFNDLEAAKSRSESGAIPKPKYASDAIQSHINNAKNVADLEVQYQREKNAVTLYDLHLIKVSNRRGSKRELAFARADLHKLCRQHGLPDPSPDYERVQEMKAAGQL